MSKLDEKTIFAVRINKREHRYLIDILVLAGFALAFVAVLSFFSLIKYALCEDKSEGMIACILPKTSK